MNVLSRQFFLIVLVALVGVLQLVSAESLSEQKIGPYVIGEILHYSINWGFIQVGEGTFETTLELEDPAEPLIRLRFTSKSRGIAGALYKVDDCIDAYIHPKTLKPLRVEKKTKEGDFTCDSTLWFNYEAMTVRWENRQEEQSIEYTLEGEATDFYSLLYRLRSMDIEEGTNQVQVAVDDKLHQMNVSVGETKKLKLSKRGKISCRKILLSAVSEGLFVRKIPSDIWVSTEEPKVLARMKIKVPVGSVKVVFQRREVLPAESYSADSPVD